jgi:hypothetical protein
MFNAVGTSTAGWGNWSAAKFFSTGDFNHDGKTDWSWYAPWANKFIVMLSTGNGHWNAIETDTTGWGNWSAGAFFSTGDFNGDGRTDWSWYAPWANKFEVMLSTGDGHFSAVETDTSGWGNWSGALLFATGDFNHDGKTDWSWYAPASFSPRWFAQNQVTMLSTGDGHFRPIYDSTSSWGDWGAKFFATGDFTGDGKTDWSWYSLATNAFEVMRSTQR